jgi:hypothetical protein
LTLSAEQLASAVEARRASYVPAERHVVVGRSLRKRTPPAPGVGASDADIISLLLEGDFKPALAWLTLHGGQRYVLERPEVTATMESFTAGTQIVALHSNLGNGKTIVSETITLRALEAGYGVFWLRRRTGDILAECEAIVEHELRPFIIIEDYPEYLDVIQYLLQHGGQKVRLLVTARSSVHDIVIDRLSESAGNLPIAEYSLDHLEEGEARWIVDWLDEYGLWGKSANLPKSRKLAIITHQCRSELQGVLVNILKSPQVAARFQQLLERIDNRRAYHQAVLATLIMTVLGFPPTPNIIADLCGEEVFQVGFRRDPAVRQLLDFGKARLRLRSSVASQFILQQVADPATIVDVLVNLARRASAAAPASLYYQDLVRSLMRFGQVQQVLPLAQRREALLRYYESIKNLDHCRRQPLFWLQYAIACLTLEELERAGRYFETAYSLTSGRQYDTYQIDNHFARYILVRAAKSRDKDQVIDALRKARKIIERQVRNERVHYPYRAASNYLPAFEAVEDKLNPAELAEFRDAAGAVLDRINSLNPYRARHWAVVECKKVLNGIVAATIKRGIVT